MKERGGLLSSPETVPAWSLQANDLINTVLRVVKVSLLWWALTLLGGVVLGIAPATCAAADVFRAEREDRPTPVVATMWRVYRREFLTADARLLPLIVAQVLAVTTVALALSGRVSPASLMVLLVVAGAVSAGWITASAAVLASSPRLRRQNLLVTWRVALLAPGAIPAGCFLLIVVLVPWFVLCTVIPPRGILAGPGAAIQAASTLVGRRVDTLLDASDDE